MVLCPTELTSQAVGERSTISSGAALESLFINSSHCWEHRVLAWFPFRKLTTIQFWSMQEIRSVLPPFSDKRLPADGSIKLLCGSSWKSHVLYPGQQDKMTCQSEQTQKARYARELNFWVSHISHKRQQRTWKFCCQATAALQMKILNYEEAWGMNKRSNSLKTFYSEQKAIWWHLTKSHEEETPYEKEQFYHRLFFPAQLMPKDWFMHQSAPVQLSC